MKTSIDQKRKHSATLEGIKKGNIPQYVYKYMDIECAKAIIKNNTIRFKSASSFNDPFDGKAYVTKFPVSFDEMVTFWNLSSLPKKEQQKFISCKLWHGDGNEIMNTLFRYFDRNTAITCFSEIDDNLLMWSHYANKHEGACMKFDVSKDLDFFSILSKVKYSKDFVTYDWAEVYDNIYDQYTTKSSDWEYEHEIRLLKTNTIPQDIKFNKTSLVEISFGCKSSPDIIEDLKNLLKQYDYIDVNLRLANIAPKNYKLDFSPL